MLNHRNLPMWVDVIQEPVRSPLEMNVDNLMGNLEMSCNYAGSLLVMVVVVVEGGKKKRRRRRRSNDDIVHFLYIHSIIIQGFVIK